MDKKHLHFTHIFLTCSKERTLPFPQTWKRISFVTNTSFSPLPAENPGLLRCFSQIYWKHDLNTNRVSEPWRSNTIRCLLDSNQSSSLSSLFYSTYGETTCIIFRDFLNSINDKKKPICPFVNVMVLFFLVLFQLWVKDVSKDQWFVFGASVSKTRISPRNENFIAGYVSIVLYCLVQEAPVSTLFITVRLIFLLIQIFKWPLVRNWLLSICQGTCRRWRAA